MKKTENIDLGRVSVEDFKKSDKQNIVLILDNVRSGMNVGSSFRTSDAFSIQNLSICGISVQPPHREILKTALGSTASVDWTYFEDTKAAVTHWRAHGYKIWAVEQAEPKTWLQDMEMQADTKVALVFGNEVSGVEDEVIEMCDGVIEIPQFGTKHSLNIAVSIGIVLWELTRQLKFSV